MNIAVKCETMTNLFVFMCVFKENVYNKNKIDEKYWTSSIVLETHWKYKYIT